MTVSHRLGVDFGTSNSAAGYMRDGKPCLIQIEAGETTIPTAFFFDFDTRKTLTGNAANAALLDGVEGRYMRALKRVLGTSLMHEERRILNERVTFVDIIARFLKMIKIRAENESGMRFDRVLSGRPVRFHSDDPKRDAQAEADLRLCYLAAGFSDVDFMAEPEAAAIAARGSVAQGSIGMVVDIGGGTSDFSVFEACHDGTINIISNQGVTIGGTDFDRVLSVDHVMPLLGKATQLRKEFGPGSLPAPNAIFQDLATWEKIPFLYNAKTRNMVKEMNALALDRVKMKRLANVLELELGHDLAFAVERGKIAVNDRAGQNAQVDLGFIEPALQAAFSNNAVQESLQLNVDAITACALETVRAAGLAPAQIDQIIFVGGSSLLSAVSTAIGAAFSQSKPIYSEVFTAVTDGLAIAA